MLKATDVTWLLCPYRVAISVFVSIFQSLIVLSYDALTRIVPELLKITSMTASLCPDRLAISVFVSIFQSLIVL